jgi:hypothetical protein
VRFRVFISCRQRKLACTFSKKVAPYADHPLR